MRNLQAFDVRRAWDRVRPGLEKVWEMTAPDWRCEDIYAALVGKRAHLFMPDEQSGDFVVLTQIISVYTGEAYLVVLAAYSKAGDAVATYQSDIDDIARESGCKWIEFVSPRKGWKRHAITHGYKPWVTVYRREL